MRTTIVKTEDEAEAHAVRSAMAAADIDTKATKDLDSGEYTIKVHSSRFDRAWKELQRYRNEGNIFGWNWLTDWSDDSRVDHKWSFTAEMSGILGRFGFDVADNYEATELIVERLGLLEDESVMWDPETSCSYFYFNNAYAARRFLDGLNKMVDEMEESRTV